MKECAQLLAEYPAYSDRAAGFAAKVRDISEILTELGPVAPRHPLPVTIAYHDACHLAHGQKVTLPPRELLNWIPGLKVVSLYESDMCCGAAGTYNLTQPEMARQLAERKLRHIQATGARIRVTGTVRCPMQVQSAAPRRGVD